MREYVKPKSFVPEHEPVRKTEYITSDDLVVLQKCQDHEIQIGVGVLDTEVGLDDADWLFHISC